MKARFEIFKEFQEWYYKLVASNGRTLFTSEEYSSKNNARQGCEALKKAAKQAKIVIAE